jgi:CRISPR-associated protein Cmr2
MSEAIYTAITFAPVQGFIEKSRKLRDLYGSSFLLSFLAKVICQSALSEQHEVISPAQINVTQGTPNQIIIKGNFSEASAKKALDKAWEKAAHICREWIEAKLPNHPYHWDREWKAWVTHGWEFFWAQSEISIGDVRKRLSEKKRKRSWTGINWQSESSTLSGADSIAWYGMCDQVHPISSSLAEQSSKISSFYQELSAKVGESILDSRERLSIPELIKRLITLEEVAKELTLEKVSEQLRLVDRELPSVGYPINFADLNRHDNQENRYTGWFQGDGDKIGEYLKKQSEKEDEARALNNFSKAMMEWGKDLPKYLPSAETSRGPGAKGKIIYSGGDDFLGVLYDNNDRLTPKDCLDWFYKFHKDIWPSHKQEITVSVGFVWAGAGVPQRDILQHCREAEKSAKSSGRDRLAIRILFNSGNHLEWVCPWKYLSNFLDGYRDRSGQNNWTHFYNDVSTLQSRYTFSKNSSDVALELFELYFNKDNRQTLEKHRDTIIGNSEPTEKHQLLNQWIINLAKVGFQLHV